MQNEIITLKYSKIVDGAPVGVTKEATLTEVLVALDRMLQQPNAYTIRSEGEQIMAFVSSYGRVVAYGEARVGGGFYYSYEMHAARDFEIFVQELRITQLLPTHNGLFAHFPISPEVWLK